MSMPGIPPAVPPGLPDDVAEQIKRHADLIASGADPDAIGASLDAIIDSAPATPIKFDQGKPEWSVLPFDALEEVVRVMMHGDEKYGKGNWRGGLAYSRLFNASIRHMVSWWNGETRDAESQCHHLASACFGLLALLHFHEHGTDRTDLDDRTP